MPSISCNKYMFKVNEEIKERTIQSDMKNNLKNKGVV